MFFSNLLHIKRKKSKAQCYAILFHQSISAKNRFFILHHLKEHLYELIFKVKKKKHKLNENHNYSQTVPYRNLRLFLDPLNNRIFRVILITILKINHVT